MSQTSHGTVFLLHQERYLISLCTVHFDLRPRRGGPAECVSRWRSAAQSALGEGRGRGAEGLRGVAFGAHAHAEGEPRTVVLDVAEHVHHARAVRRADSVSRRETRRADHVALRMRSGACRLVE